MNSDEPQNSADRKLDAIFRAMREEPPSYVESAGGL